MPTIRPDAENEDISPEEKLLKVIQGVGEPDEGPTPEEKLLDSVQSETPAPEPAPEEAQTVAAVGAVEPAAEPVAEPAEATEPAAAKPPPKLKLAEKPAVAASAAEAPAPPTEEVAAGAPLGAGSAEGSVGAVTMAPEGPSRRSEGRSLGLGIVNWGLAAAIAFILFMTGRVMWGSIRGSAEGANAVPDAGSQQAEPGTAAGIDAAGGETARGAEPYDIEQVVTAYINAPIVTPASQAGTVTNGTGRVPPPPPPPPQQPWEQYARKNFKLLGISRISADELEGIMSDDSIPKMIYVQKGHEMQIQKVTVAVARVDGNGIDLTDGKKTVTIK